MNRIKYLDCTFRDGGYYNNWDFSKEMAQEVVEALNKAKVDIIEIGYKSKSEKEFAGLFKYCNEDYLSFLNKNDYSKYAFMVDIKEFIVNDSIDYTSLDQIINTSDSSVFTWVRLASHYSTLSFIKEFIKYFKNKGYKVAFNMMGVSLLSDEMLKEGLIIAENTHIDAFYIADSFGSFYPNDIRKLIKFCKQHFSGNIGIHAHDNQGLAYYNTIAAIEEGVSYVDGTITGMGRGAGNLKTEQFLLGKDSILKEMNKRDFNSLLRVIGNYFFSLKEKYNWGYSYAYMFSGINNIHQAYCQELQELNRFSIQEIGVILNHIPQESKSKFDKRVLKESIQLHLSTSNKNKASKKISLLEPDSKISTKILVAAGGDSIHKYKEDIFRKIEKEDINLIEINDTKAFQSVSNRVTVILNKHKLESFLENNSLIKNTVITGQEYIKENIYNENLRFMPYRIGTPNLEKDKIVISDYDAGIFGILLALMKKPSSLYLAGFDGTKNEEKNNIINTFLSWLTNYCNEHDIEVKSITPTIYSNIKKSSIYFK